MSLQLGRVQYFHYFALPQQTNGRLLNVMVSFTFFFPILLFLLYLMIFLYRSVTKDLVQSAVLSLTRTINEKLLAATLNTTMLFFKALFSDVHLQAILTG